MAYTQLISQAISGGRVEEIKPGEAYHLSLPKGRADKYRLAQLDDYAKVPRRRFPWEPPVSLTLSARTSSASIPGTWGFGLWNYPFGISWDSVDIGWRLPTTPNAVWFFGASEENHLSFRDDKPGHGFLAQSFQSPPFHPLLIAAGLTIPFSRKATRRLMAKVIDEDGIRLSVDVTRWHSYRLDWREDLVAFAVDGDRVFESSISPRPRLGLVIWIDNQYAAFTPEGKIGFGALENPEPVGLEIKEIEIYRGGQ